MNGGQGEGKTTLVTEVVRLLQKEKIKVGGFVAPGNWKKGVRSGFDLLNISDHYTIPLCQDEPRNGYLQNGRFWFNPKAIQAGERILDACRVDETKVIVLDEVGKFELEGKVWHDALREILAANNKAILLTVRKKLIQDVIRQFKIHHYTLYSTTDSPLMVVKDVKMFLETDGV